MVLEKGVYCAEAKQTPRSMAPHEDPQDLIRDQEGQQREMLPRQERQAPQALPLQRTASPSGFVLGAALQRDLIGTGSRLPVSSGVRADLWRPPFEPTLADM